MTLYPDAHVWLLNDQEYVGPLWGNEAVERLSQVYGLDFARFFQLTDAFRLLLSQEYDPVKGRWYFRNYAPQKLSLLRTMVLEEPFFFEELFDFLETKEKREKLARFAGDLLSNLRAYYDRLQRPFGNRPSVFDWEIRRRHPFFLMPIFFGMKEFSEGGIRQHFGLELQRLPELFDDAILETAQEAAHADLLADRSLWASDLVKRLYAIYNRRSGYVFWRLTEMSRAIDGLRKDLEQVQQQMDAYSAYLRMHALLMGRRTARREQQAGNSSFSPSLLARLPDDVFRRIVNLSR